jgi:hypothetical protein
VQHREGAPAEVEDVTVAQGPRCRAGRRAGSYPGLGVELRGERARVGVVGEQVEEAPVEVAVRVGGPEQGAGVGQVRRTLGRRGARGEQTATVSNSALPPVWSKWWWVLTTSTGRSAVASATGRIGSIPRPVSTRSARSRPATSQLLTWDGSATSHAPGETGRTWNQPRDTVRPR